MANKYYVLKVHKIQNQNMQQKKNDTYWDIHTHRQTDTYSHGVITEESLLYFAD